MNKNYKCVLFDLDGTIIDSGPDLIDSLNFALQLENFNHIDKNILGSLVGGGAKVMIEKALKHLNEEVNENKLESMISSFLEFYLKNCSIKSKLYGNVISTLQIIKPKFKIGLCTNKKQHLTEKILKDFKIEKYFDFILGSSANLKLKPDNEMLDFSLKKLNCSPIHSVMVGDSGNDITPAKELGMTSVFVTYGYGKLNNLIKPDFIIKEFKKVCEILN